MKRFIVVLLVVWLSSCANIPFGTMLEFRSFNKDNFLEIQPQDIKAKIQIEKPVRANFNDVELSLQLATKKRYKVICLPTNFG